MQLAIDLQVKWKYFLVLLDTLSGQLSLEKNRKKGSGGIWFFTICRFETSDEQDLPDQLNILSFHCEVYYYYY